MEILGSVLRSIHVAAACASLLVLGVPLLARKGSSLHKRVGWSWVACMSVVIASGTTISVMSIVAPRAVRPDVAEATVRMSGAFLLLIGAMSASSIWQGIRSIQRKSAPQASRHPVDIGLPIFVIALGAFVAAAGVARSSLLLSIVGAGAMLVTSAHLKFALRPLPSKMAWWYGHMNGMLGAVIATATAFSIAGLRRFVAIPEELGFVPWVAPTLLLTPVFTLWGRYYRAKFGDRPAPRRDGAGAETA